MLLRLRLLLLPPLFLRRGFHGKTQPAFVIRLEHFHAHLLAFLQVIGDCVHALVGDLRDVQQTVTARKHAHDRAEFEELQNGAVVDLAELDVRGQLCDALACSFAAFR